MTLALSQLLMIRRVCNVLAVLALASTPAAAAFTVMLANDSTHTRVTIAEVPGARDAFVVAWQDIPGTTPATGAMVYYREHGDSETRWLAVGGGGLFSIIDRGWGHLRRGTAVATAYVISDDPAHPLVLADTEATSVDVPALLAKYAAFENIAARGEPRSAIEAAITAKTAQTNRACGSHVAAKLDWKSFATPASLALAKQTISIFEAIEHQCGDKDYAAAVQAMREVRVDYQADGGALRLDKTGGVLGVHLSDTSWNPRETAAVWLKDHL